MIALQITAITPRGIALSRPWGIAFDGLLASVVWHRRKRAALAAGGNLTYQVDGPQEALPLPLARCGDPSDDDWHWLATFADLHPRIPFVTEPDIRWRTSRTDRNRLQQLAPNIGRQVVSDTTGRYQRRVISVMAYATTHLTWRAVGEIGAASRTDGRLRPLRPVDGTCRYLTGWNAEARFCECIYGGRTAPTPSGPAVTWGRS